MDGKNRTVGGEILRTEDRSVILLWQEELTEQMLCLQTCFEMICVLEGTCRCTVNAREEELQKGDLCLVVSREVCVAEPEAGGRILYILARQENMENSFYNILRDQNEISDLLLSSMYEKGDDSCRIFRTGADEEIRKQILAMYAEQRRCDDVGSDRIIICMLVIFLTGLMRQYQGVAPVAQRKAGRPGDTQFLRDIFRDYRTITLSELAKRLNYSVPYCSRYIKETTGRTFLQLLHMVRFQKAEDYLHTTTFSIQKISALVGYESPENFIRAFKKEYGISPSQYRARHT